MDLVQVKQYLRERRVAPLPDIALHFRVDNETIRPLLETWVNKGKARKQTGTAGKCRGCCKCDPASVETYEWVGE